MPNTIYDPTLWANFGIPGLTLFILFIFVITFMVIYSKTNGKAINNLCDKIEKLADSNTDMVKSLTGNFVKMTEDQNNNARILIQILESTQDSNGKLNSLTSRIDDLMSLKCKPRYRETDEEE